MKKQLLIAGLFLLSSLSVFAQDSRMGEMNHSDSLAVKLYGEGQYGKAAEVWLKELQRRDAAGMKQDTTYIYRLVQVARCQHRCNDSSSISTARKIVELYEKNVGKKDKNYSFYLDNLGTYLGANNEYAEAEKACKQALDVYETFRKNDYDKAIILIHLAEMAAGNKHTSDAIAYEIRALSILKDMYGEHSRQYTDEAVYLQQYYEKNGDASKAAQVKERVDRLVKETKDGVVDLPEMVKFTSPAVAKDHEQDMRRVLDYFFNHRLTDKKINQCASYIMDWTAVSDAVTVNVASSALKLTGSKTHGVIYMVAYMAGCDEYALETGNKGPDFDMFVRGMVRALNFYQNNRDLTGEIEYNEDLIKTYAKGQSKFMDKLKQLYDEDLKVAEKSESVKMKAGDRLVITEVGNKKEKKKK